MNKFRKQYERMENVAIIYNNIVKLIKLDNIKRKTLAKKIGHLSKADENNGHLSIVETNRKKFYIRNTFNAVNLAQALAL